MTGLAGLHIPADQSKPCTPEAIAGDQLRELQRIVGGYIELIPCGRLQVVVNEEGALRDLAWNHRATALQQMCQGDRVAFLRGDAVLVGPTNAGGEFEPLDPEVLRLIGEAFDGLVRFDAIKAVAS